MSVNAPLKHRPHTFWLLMLYYRLSADGIVSHPIGHCFRLRLDLSILGTGVGTELGLLAALALLSGGC